MPSTGDLKSASTHFEFGKNWESFVSTINDRSMSEAEAGLGKLFPNGELRDADVLDVGCGSGLSMLAAKRLGAASVTGIDIDRHSVQASRKLLSAHLPAGCWSCIEESIFDFSSEREQGYDIVYSWGVLHHTGDMWAAINKAAAQVKPGGLLVIALYRRTPLCRFWTTEKRFYTKASEPIKALVRFLYKSVFIVGLIATGRNPVQYIRTYVSNRGMSWHHDVHDWLGGYPYQSVSPEEVTDCVARIGFKLIRSFNKPAAVKGIFGTHCDEFVAVRQP